MIPIYKVVLSKESIYFVNDAISSGWISSIGKYVEIASNFLKEYTGSKYVILTNNGTSATHLVTKCLHKFRPHIQKILVPSSCYVAVYNSLLYDNYPWKVECIDINEHTWNMQLNYVASDEAVFAVHNLGNMMNVPAILNKHRCEVIEDNCEGFFGTYSGAKSGTASLCSSLSFFGNKNITCGEGGAFFTNDEEIWHFANKVRGQGMTEKRFVHDELGYNYRITNVQAAILLGQLQNIEQIFARKRNIFDLYNKLLNNVEDISMQKVEENTTHSLWMFAVRFYKLASYDDAYHFFHERQIETRPMFYPFKKHKHLNFIGDSSVAEDINKSVVVFPSYDSLTNDEITYICDKIMEFTQFIKSKNNKK